MKFVEIWGKAAIGFYLWEHILEGPLEQQNGELLQYGEMKIQNIMFRFRTGPLVRPDSIPPNTRYLVLVINGREPKKIDFARTWLDSLKNLRNLSKAAVVLLGSENCDNSWFLPYLVQNGGTIKFAFIVYDIPNLDNKIIYQWPLGVATYRKFPSVRLTAVDIKKPRKYKCNFMGTVYERSSREKLSQIINSRQDIRNICYMKIRNKWLPNESDESRSGYVKILENSDLTLCPVGINSECYRIYEAMSCGSVPVVEDVMTPGMCGKSSHTRFDAPLRILKEMKAPVIYVRTWDELIDILEKETLLTVEQVQKRRENVIHWYSRFKSELKDKFVKVISENFGPVL